MGVCYMYVYWWYYGCYDVWIWFDDIFLCIDDDFDDVCMINYRDAIMMMDALSIYDVCVCNDGNRCMLNTMYDYGFNDDG